jgi:hypothetical protein
LAVGSPVRRRLFDATANGLEEQPEQDSMIHDNYDPANSDTESDIVVANDHVASVHSPGKGSNLDRVPPSHVAISQLPDPHPTVDLTTPIPIVVPPTLDQIEQPPTIVEVAQSTDAPGQQLTDASRQKLLYGGTNSTAENAGGQDGARPDAEPRDSSHHKKQEIELISSDSVKPHSPVNFATAGHISPDVAFSLVSAVSSLRPGNWVNGTALGHIVEAGWVSSDLTKQPIRRYRPDLSAIDMVVVPLCHSQRHWTVGLIHCKTGRLELYDPIDSQRMLDASVRALRAFA